MDAAAAQPPRAEAKNMPPACHCEEGKARRGNLRIRDTDSHTSDVGHWFGMTEREYPDGMTEEDRQTGADTQGYLFRFALLRSLSAPTEELRRIFVGAGDSARPTGKCVSLGGAVEVKMDATAA